MLSLRPLPPVCANSFAELLSDMVTHTRAEVSENAVEQFVFHVMTNTIMFNLSFHLDRPLTFLPKPDNSSSIRSIVGTSNHISFQMRSAWPPPLSSSRRCFTLRGWKLTSAAVSVRPSPYRRFLIRSHFPICLSEQLALFLWHLRQIYRHQNSYHNFHHALDVLQATHVFLSSAGLVPKATILSQAGDPMWRSNRPKTGAFVECLTNTDIFALYIAAIGHDVGHPGLTNSFMVHINLPAIHVERY